MNIPIEIVNHILSFRPTHPNALSIKYLIKNIITEMYDIPVQISIYIPKNTLALSRYAIYNDNVLTLQSLYDCWIYRDIKKKLSVSNIITDFRL